MRRAAWSLGLAAAVALSSACSSGPKPTAAPVGAAEPAPTTVTMATTTTQPIPEDAPHFSLGTPDIQAVRAAAELSEEVRGGIQGVLDRYLNDATVTPLREAEPAGDLGGIFTGPALERAAGPDRAALLDEGLPRVARLNVGDASAQLTALVGADGVAVVAAGIHVLVTGAVTGGGLTIERSGELHLARDGDAWKVSGYDVSVTRSGPDGVITTTTTSAP